MEKNFEEALVEYLKKNGAKEIPADNKGKLEMLKNIVFNEKTNLDIIDIRNAKAKEEGSANSNEYLGRITNIHINIHNALYYIANIKAIIKEDKKLKRKAAIKKIFRIKNR